MSDISQIKKKIREKIWDLMEKKNIARFPRPVYGRIPNFIGADRAAALLRKQPEWKKFGIIFANPDSPQRYVRFFALRDSKKVVIATPRIKKGFILLDPEKIPEGKYWEASTIRGAFRYGKTVQPDEIQVDAKITGSVAVDRYGGRVGKGHGFSDIEYGILREYNVIGRSEPIITTVHDVQVVDKIPMITHDMPVDIIVTPTKVIRTKTNYAKPKGIIWESISCDKIKEIPILLELAKTKYKKMVENR